MKKSWEQTIQERAEDRNARQLGRLRRLLAEDFWSAKDTALIMIGVDPLNVQTNDRGDWDFQCLPGRSRSYWSNPDGEHLHPNFDDNFAPEYSNAKQIAFSKGKDAIDKPSHWITHFQHWKIETPWIFIAREDDECSKYLPSDREKPNFSNQPEKQADVSRQSMGGKERAKGLPIYHVAKGIENYLLAWNKNEKLYPNLRAFRKDMRLKYIDPEADLECSDFDQSIGYKVRSHKTIKTCIDKLIENHDLSRVISKIGTY